MLIANLDFTDEIVERIRVVVRGTANLTRGALSRMVCGWIDWHGFDGRAKEASCRAALLKLERQGVIELPPAREVSFESSSPAVAPPEPAWLRIKGALSKLSGIGLVVVNGEKALSRQWRVIMRAHHPLSEGPLRGAQLLYLITSEPLAKVRTSNCSAAPFVRWGRFFGFCDHFLVTRITLCHIYHDSARIFSCLVECTDVEER